MFREEEGKVIQVYNITFHGEPKAENEVYIGLDAPFRPCLKPSPLGNRASRDRAYAPKEAVAMYKGWLAAVIEDASPHSKALKEIGRLHALLVKHGELKLYCWCSPEEPLTSAEPHICHGQVLAYELEKIEKIKGIER